MFDDAVSYLEDLGYETERMTEKAIWSAVDRNFPGGRNAFKAEIAHYATI